jgi:hypothetical protein
VLRLLLQFNTAAGEYVQVETQIGEKAIIKTRDSSAYHRGIPELSLLVSRGYNFGETGCGNRTARVRKLRLTGCLVVNSKWQHGTVLDENSKSGQQF